MVVASLSQHVNGCDLLLESYQESAGESKMEREPLLGEEAMVETTR
jgi:hypothetical protein